VTALSRRGILETVFLMSRSRLGLVAIQHEPEEKMLTSICGVLFLFNASNTDILLKCQVN